MSIETANIVREYSDGPSFPRRTITVRNHGIYGDRVVLEIGDERYIVLVSDLRAAITNAINAHNRL